MQESRLKDLSFEEALSQLEQTLKALEGSDLSLDQAIDTYEAGMRLAGICTQHLDRAELRFQQVQGGLDPRDEQPS